MKGKKFDLISLMVDETFKEGQRNQSLVEDRPVQISKNPSIRFFDKFHIPVYLATQFLNGLYRIKIQQDTLDIPSDWYGVNELKFSNHHVIDRDNDDGLLLKVLNQYNRGIKKILILKQGECFYVGLFTKSQLHILDRFLEKIESSNKVAA